MKKLRIVLLCFSIFVVTLLEAQFANPIIHADYSDPDAIRVGNDYYMTASSFNSVPGLPILHSKDLVHWQLVGHALQKLVPESYFDTVRHGGGVWAPAIRFYKNEFYIFYPDPDFGIYVIKAKKATGPWSQPKLVQGGKGLIDPCPLWDDDGKVYLAHAYAGSRAGIKSIIVIKELNKAADSVVGNAVLVYDGHETDATIEGPKLYKRNGYYYIFAPAGGVSTGWQTVLKSKNIYGPYERRIVLEQGNSNVNGPHQGAWLTDTKGNDWFIHFQDKDAYGRIVHLQPMVWKNDYPIIGLDSDNDGKGTPVKTVLIKEPAVSNTIATSDDFNATAIGKQWQWQANPKEHWAFATPNGHLKMFATQVNPEALVWNMPNVLTQKFPSETFEACVKFDFKPNTVNEKFGLVVLGIDYAYLSVVKKAEANYLSLYQYEEKKSTQEKIVWEEKINATTLFFKVAIKEKGVYQFSYSVDGLGFAPIPISFTATPGKWVGAKVGIFNTRVEKTNNAGYTEIDYFTIK